GGFFDHIEALSPYGCVRPAAEMGRNWGGQARGASTTSGGTSISWDRNPRARLPPFRLPAVGGARLELADMGLHVGEAIEALRVGRGALLLLVIDEVALEEDDRGARHRRARLIAHLALDEAVVVEGDVDVPC